MSSTASHRFEYVKDNSSKFWEVSVQRSQLTTKWGRIGTQGQSKTKSFADKDSAQKEMAKLIAAKTREGYVQVTSSSVQAKQTVKPAKPASTNKDVKKKDLSEKSSRATKSTLSIRRFELSKGKSIKFWEVSTTNDILTTKGGNIGNGQASEKIFDSPKQAIAEMEKLIAAKLKEGYVEINLSDRVLHPVWGLLKCVADPDSTQWLGYFHLPEFAPSTANPIAQNEILSAAQHSLGVMNKSHPTMSISIMDAPPTYINKDARKVIKNLAAIGYQTAGFLSYRDAHAKPQLGENCTLACMINTDLNIYAAVYSLSKTSKISMYRVLEDGRIIWATDEYDYMNLAIKVESDRLDRYAANPFPPTGILHLTVESFFVHPPTMQKIVLANSAGKAAQSAALKNFGRLFAAVYLDNRTQSIAKCERIIKQETQNTTKLKTLDDGRLIEKALFGSAPQSNSAHITLTKTGWVLLEIPADDTNPGFLDTPSLHAALKRFLDRRTAALEETRQLLVECADDCDADPAVTIENLSYSAVPSILRFSDHGKNATADLCFNVQWDQEHGYSAQVDKNPVTQSK